MRIVLFIFMAVALGACATKAPTVGSTAGGECKLTHTSTYAIKGATPYDQEWADDTTEALVRGCKQPRPKARPASLDARAKSQPSQVVPAKRLHWWQKR